MFKRLSTIQKFKNTGRRLLILVLQYYITMYIHSHTKCITPHFKKNLPRTFKKLNLFNRNVNARHTTMGGYQLRKATRVTQVTNKWKYGQENSLNQNYLTICIYLKWVDYDFGRIGNGHIVKKIFVKNQMIKNWYSFKDLNTEHRFKNPHTLSCVW